MRVSPRPPPPLLLVLRSFVSCSLATASLLLFIIMCRVESRLAQEGRALFAEVLRLKQLAQNVINGVHHPAIGIQVVKLMETFVLCFSSAEV